MLRQDRASVAIRRQVLLDTLRDQPLSTCRMLSDRIHAETDERLWIPVWTMYPMLRALENEGLVERLHVTAREVLWKCT